MINDATYLRFSFDGEQERISIKTLEAVTSAIQNAFQQCFTAYVEAEIYLVAAPRRGSIEIPIQVEVKSNGIDADELREILAKQKRTDILPQLTAVGTAASGLAALGALLWAVVFAEHGLLDRHNKGDTNRAFRQFEQEGIGDLDKRFVRGLRKEGLSSVEIQLPSSKPVILWAHAPAELRSISIVRTGQKSKITIGDTEEWAFTARVVSSENREWEQGATIQVVWKGRGNDESPNLNDKRVVAYQVVFPDLVRSPMSVPVIYAATMSNEQAELGQFLRSR